MRKIITERKLNMIVENTVRAAIKEIIKEANFSFSKPSEELDMGFNDMLARIERVYRLEGEKDIVPIRWETVCYDERTRTFDVVFTVLASPENYLDIVKDQLEKDSYGIQASIEPDGMNNGVYFLSLHPEFLDTRGYRKMNQDTGNFLADELKSQMINDLGLSF